MSSSVFVRDATQKDIEQMLAVYYKVERRSPVLPMEGWTPLEMRAQLSYWIRDRHLAIVLVSELGGLITGFTICLFRSQEMATLEIFCTDPDHRGDFRKTGETWHSGELLFREICARLRAVGVSTVNTMVNKEYFDFKRHSHFLEYRGFNRVGEFVEYEFELSPTLRNPS